MDDVIAGEALLLLLADGRLMPVVPEAGSLMRTDMFSSQMNPLLPTRTPPLPILSMYWRSLVFSTTAVCFRGGITIGLPVALLTTLTTGM